MKYKVDLSADIGESFGVYNYGTDEEIVKYISSANVACGFHAGDPTILAKTISIAKKYNIKVGAHPGYPDILGFGRRKMNISRQDLQNYIIYQIGAISSFLKINNLSLQHVKPHGAMMHYFEESLEKADIFAEVIFNLNKDLIIVGISGGEVIKAAKLRGLKCAEEVYADRSYQSNGKLVPRSKKNAMITEHKYAVQRIVKVIQTNELETENGTMIKVKPDTICVHGDSLIALNFVKLLRAELKKNDIEVVNMGFLRKR